MDSIKSSITQRWLKNSLLITFIVLLIAESAFIIYTKNSYYSSAAQAMQNRISIIEGRLLASDQSNAIYEEKMLVIKSIIEEFDEKDKFELMTLDNNGNILLSSSGFVSNSTFTSQDFELAIQSSSGIGKSDYHTDTHENIMSICYMLPNVIGDVVAIRFATSLTEIDEQVSSIVLISLLICLVIIFFSIFSGRYFIKSIVNPLVEIEKTALSISQGDFNARVTHKHNDEVGRLCFAINNMAEELRKIDQVKNSFISSVSHELRTPLTSIKGWIETLERVKDPNDKNYVHGMEIVKREANRLSLMVEELLDFSGIQNNGLVLNLQNLDIVAEITDIVLIMEKRAEQEGLKIIYEEPEELYIVNGDSNRIKQVFVNICDNAFKYSSRNCQVEIKVYEKDNYVCIAIKDQGKGIAQEELEKVKTKFYKGKGSVKGSGIGLAVVDEIVKAHKGQFIIESNIGIGTTVTIKLPIERNKIK